MGDTLVGDITARAAETGMKKDFELDQNFKKLT